MKLRRSFSASTSRLRSTFVQRSLSGISPSYLADDCRLVADAREWRLRSTASRTCIVTWTRTYSTFGNRAFAAAGPGLWNSLPSHLKEADLSYNRFRHFCLDSAVGPLRRLETTLFTCLLVLFYRCRDKVSLEPHLSEEQGGFRSDRSTVQQIRYDTIRYDRRD